MWGCQKKRKEIIISIFITRQLKKRKKAMNLKLGVLSSRPILLWPHCEPACLGHFISLGLNLLISIINLSDEVISEVLFIFNFTWFLKTLLIWINLIVFLPLPCITDDLETWSGFYSEWWIYQVHLERQPTQLWGIRESISRGKSNLGA